MSKSLTLDSFFDGIGGWLLAAKHAGVNPVWASEIDDFPATVSAHHFPQVTQLGDITKINVDELEPTDIICAGSPCQDLSVAGKRKGLAGERSGLFIDAIKLVHGLRARTGKPRYFVWENVPGAFSSNKGLDFRAVLEEISQTKIPVPSGGKWAEAGVVEWDGGQLAWRVLDAQYWGVPQRRKRIFLVADFAGQSAGEILFESQSLPGNTEKGKGKREEAATIAGKSVGSTSGGECQQVAECFPQNAYDKFLQGTPLTTLKACGGSYSGGSENLIANISPSIGKVRRLTPTECERLQGLPDGYTDIEFNGKPAPDSRRYKALGNGMAQPCADYVIRRIMYTYIGNARRIE